MTFNDGQGGAIRYGQEQRPDARSDPRLTWWREARFGMFIHWGLYAIPAGEWKGQRCLGLGEWLMNRCKVPVKDYAPLTKQFNLDPDGQLVKKVRATLARVTDSGVKNSGAATKAFLTHCCGRARRIRAAGELAISKRLIGRISGGHKAARP